ncbi:hypothetical protein WJX75_002843 [Coccomyxa subellipsoidea]|uniref:RNI-like protein n=1 Tax=Coccomyxa subellipsoidea TaxID=248742 RepID=A0ABR2YG69_9CHLO
MPTPTSLEWILARCSSIHDIDASGCGQFSDNVLLALSDLPIKVLRMHGCWRVGGHGAHSAIFKFAKRDLACSGALCGLQVLDLSHMDKLSAGHGQPDATAEIAQALYVGLEAVAKGCPRLIKLAVGGPSFSWREDKGLAAFKGLKHLTISRRTRCTDSSLVKVLEQHPVLESFRLSAATASPRRLSR